MVNFSKQPPAVPSEPQEVVSHNISEDLRHALQEAREVSYENHGEQKVIKVDFGKKTYRFLRGDSWGPAWVMDISDDKGKYLDSVTIHDEADVSYLESLSLQDFSDNLRRALEEGREVTYENYGERKIVRVKYAGKNFKFYQDNREYADWVMDIEDEEGKMIDSVDVREDADVEYLEGLFKQDITDALRRLLLEEREVDYENYGDRKIVKVKHDGKTYKFYQESREYADWVMEIEDEKGQFFDSVDVREESDVQFLQELFDTPTKEELAQGTRDDIFSGS